MFDYNLIYNTYRPKLIILVSKVLKDKDSVEDIVQEILLRVYTEQDKYDKNNGYVSTWVYTVAFNYLKNYFRDIKQTPHLTYVKEILDNDSTTSLDNPVDILSSAQTEDRYNYLLSNLSDSLLSAYELKEVEGMSHKDIATTLGISEETSKQRVKRARDYISSYLLAP